MNSKQLKTVKKLANIIKQSILETAEEFDDVVNDNDIDDRPIDYVKLKKIQAHRKARRDD